SPTSPPFGQQHSHLGPEGGGSRCLLPLLRDDDRDCICRRAHPIVSRGQVQLTSTYLPTPPSPSGVGMEERGVAGT
ncbi:hypothetical protein CH063_14407, partial [Colletotrichum higginsianum]